MNPFDTSFEAQYELALKTGNKRFGSECKHETVIGGRCKNCLRLVATKHYIRFYSNANPDNIQREVINASTATEARDIMQASDCTVLDIESEEQRQQARENAEIADWMQDAIDAERDARDLRETQENARY